MSVFVSSICLNHDPGSSVDSALNVRKNAVQPAILPEWQRGRSGTDSPAAYAINRLGTLLRIQAEFQCVDPALHTVQVRAIDRPAEDIERELATLTDPRLLSWLPAYFTTAAQYQAFSRYTQYYFALLRLYWQVRLSTPGSVLGEIKPTTITFGTGGGSGPVLLELQNVRLQDRGVGIHPVTWRWQFRQSPGSTWVDAGFTDHTIYALVDLPTSPWTQTPFVMANLQLPWTDVMKWACGWAAGARDVDTAARRITENVNALGNRSLTYSCAVLGAEMYASTLFDRFNCTAFLDRLNGGAGNGQFVNCTDCATIVSTFANVLGCDLSQSRMGDYARIFETNPVITIGSKQWQQPCNLWQGFTYHEVAWTGLATADDPVYDATLLLAVDPSSIPQVPVLPVRMPFGEVGEGAYRDRLAAPSSRTICRPRPEERRRRQVF